MLRSPRVTMRDTAPGKDIVRFLQDNTKALEQVTAEVPPRPAVAGVQRGLVREFPNLLENNADKVEQDRYRQFVGRVICEIMLSNRYVKDHRDAVKPPAPFNKGMIYRKAETK